MPLSIAQALSEIPVLKSAKVVAGGEKLDNIIIWTHIVDHPDVLPWVQEGYLLLTTAFSLMLMPEVQKNLIPHLAEKKLTGMMINIGMYMGEIPAVMVSAAKSLNFPLIALPWEINFTDVTHAIHERIINEQYALSKQVFHIHEVLSQIVIEGGGLDSLANQLADLLQRSITIEDVSFSLLAYKSINPIDSVRERSIAEGRTPEEVIAYHKIHGLYERLRQERRPQKVNPIPEIGLTLERVVAPIIVGPQLLGFIWVIATDHPLTELDFLAIERGANIAALILSRKQAIYEAEQRVKNQLFENLLDPLSSTDSRNLSEVLQNIKLSAGYQILVLEKRTQQPRLIQNRIIENCTDEEGLNTLIVERGGRSVIILASESNKKAAILADRILARGDEYNCKFEIGISARVIGVNRFRSAYEEALNALQIGLAISPQRGVFSSENLGYLLSLSTSSDEIRVANYYHSFVARIVAYDEKHNTNLLRTLSVYIDQLLDVQKTAKVLFIHRNTLYQRLDKISDLCQVDLKNILTIVNLYLAITDWNIKKSGISG
jgi:PucR family transcriptional regulator, purine catabolism regulatory protein